MMLKYEYFRCAYRGKEWQRRKADDWITVSVNSLGIALMLRER